ncbi:MAG TPA: hypothetical protein PKE31_10250, partial [Pseudomonadota bacterium]|nr:hypothetical protein [Pseudomonadota bacterium]
RMGGGPYKSPLTFRKPFLLRKLSKHNGHPGWLVLHRGYQTLLIIYNGDKNNLSDDALWSIIRRTRPAPSLPGDRLSPSWRSRFPCVEIGS